MQARNIKADYLQPCEFIRFITTIYEVEIRSFLRLMIIEGTPYIFNEIPMLYEKIRDWLAYKLGVEPLEIKLVGSARTGFSLSSPPNFGKRFNPKSDLDFAVINEELFLKCKNAFIQWKIDYESGKVSPRNSNEKKYWETNKTVVIDTINRGFIDANKIPTFHSYPISKKIGNTMWLLKEKLAKSTPSIKIERATVRVYRNWNSFHKQIEINIKKLKEKFINKK